MATDAGGWNTTTNRVLALYLARNAKLRVRAFVPKNIWRRRELAQELNIELLEDEKLPGDSPIELLNYPPEKLNHIDYLVMHSYKPDLEKQAEEICKTKKCKLINVVHANWQEFMKFVEGAVRSLGAEQIELCKKADLVITIGPKVAEYFENALQSCGKDTKVISITPGIFSELNGASQIHEDGKKFYVMIHANFATHFNVKGCDIAVKAILSLKDMSCHLIFVLSSNCDVSELTQTLLMEGMHFSQFTVKSFINVPEEWAKFIGDADILIMPSRVEGFGMSGLYAISAKIPVLVSGNSGLGMTLKTLPSGRKHVMETDDPKVWADKIKEVREKGPQTRALETEQLRKEYMKEFNWEAQCNKLVEKMIVQNGMYSTVHVMNKFIVIQLYRLVISLLTHS